MEETKPTKLHELFARPGTWTQGAFARDTYSRDVGVTDPRACRWCLIGAALSIYGGEGQDFTPVRDKLRTALSFGENSDGIFAFNDKLGRTQEEIQKLCAELDI